MPSLPRSPVRAPLRARARRRAPRAPERDEPRVEIVEAPGLRWINIERPRQVDQAWLEERFEFHPARLRGRLLAQPAPEGRRVRRLPVHRAALPALRQDGRPAQRRRARPLRRPRLPDHAPERAAAAARVPVRALPHQRGAARVALLQGPGLPALQDRRRLRRRLVPDAAQDRQQARAHRGGDLRGQQLGRGRARHLQRQAGDHQLPQDRPPAARRRSATSSATRRATSPTTSTSTSTTSTTRPSASGTCSRTTRRSSRRSSPRTSRRSRTAPTRPSGS